MLNVLNEELILWIVTYYESLHDGDLKMIGLQPKMCPVGIWTEGYGSAITIDGSGISGTGTVTSVSQGAGMSFSTITSSGSVALATPLTLTASTTNSAGSAGSGHSHAISGFLPLTGGTLTGAVSSSSTFSGTNFILTSDRRLKKNIKNIGDTSFTDNIDFKKFTFKSDKTNRIRYGVIAQELEKVAPELVYTDDKGEKAVSYIDLLIAKIAELEKRIKQLEDEKN